MDKKFTALILTDSNGTNRASARSPLSFDVCGKSVLAWVLSAAKKAGAAQIIVTGNEDESLIHNILGEDILYIPSQAGAENISEDVRAALLFPDAPIVMLYGDAPLVCACDIERTVQMQSDAVSFVCTENEENALRVTDPVQLAEVNRFMRLRINAHHAQNGVFILDLYNTFIDCDVQIQPDSVIYPNVYLKGNTTIGSSVEIMAGSLLENAMIADGVSIKSSYIYDASIGQNTTVGPFAYIRPGCVIGEKCRIGDFVELKNANIQNGTKVSHLTYVGDADVGQRVNFGCGTVTSNYDGANKFRTVIGNDVFLGCNTNLVAPVEVEDGAYIAAGSTITDRVPKDTLAIARARQVIKENWTKPKKEDKK